MRWATQISCSLLYFTVAFCPDNVSLPADYRDGPSVRTKLRINATQRYECSHGKWFANATEKIDHLDVGCMANGTLDLPVPWPECVASTNCTNDPLEGVDVDGLVSDFDDSPVANGGAVK